MKLQFHIYEGHAYSKGPGIGSGGQLVDVLRFSFATQWTSEFRVIGKWNISLATRS